MKKLFNIALILTISVTLFCNTVFAENITNEDLSSIKDTMQVITENYKTDVSKEVLINGAIKGMLSSLDPYSTYFTKEEFAEFEQSVNGEYSGIGVNIKKIDGYIEITGIIDESPAKKAGLKIGDRFVSVDDAAVINMNLDVFTAKVKGEKGTKVKVGIIRDGSKTPINFEIVRDTIKISSVEYKILDNNMGYIRINEFSKDCSDSVCSALKSFDEKKVTKVIVDLRGNPGGLLSEVISICENFIPKGPIVHVKTNGDKKTYYSKLEKTKYKLVVLVDGGSASAAEILAGAVKDTKSGTIIGTTTYGKGTVQTIFELNNGSFIKLTIADYLTSSEKSVEKSGVAPDIISKSVNLESIDDIMPLDITRNIKAGQKGADVLAVEQRLNALGYDVSGPDNNYDAITQKAVLEYKKNHKLLQNKIITKDFQKLLDHEVVSNIGKDAQLLKALEVLK